MRCIKFVPVIFVLTALTLRAQTSPPPASWFVEARTDSPAIYHDGWIDFNKNASPLTSASKICCRR